HRAFDQSAQPMRLEWRVDIHGNLRLFRPFLGVAGKRRLEAEIIEDFWPEAERDSVQLLPQPSDQRAQLFRSAIDLGAGGRDVRQRVEAESECREVLADFVV